MSIGKINVSVKKLGTLLREDFKSYSIPSVQRQFVWDPDDIEELLVSIINGFPIGSVIVWKSEKPFPSEPLCGKSVNRRFHEYILDGQQRLTSLMLLVNNWKIVRGDQEIESEQINFTPESRAFNIGKKRGINTSLIVNAALADTKAVTDLTKLYSEKVVKLALEECGSKIVNYEVPFYTLETTSEEEDDSEIYQKIADIFTRVNSKGVRIGNLEMFLAFFAANFDKKTKDGLIAVHEKYKDYGLDLEPIIRFVFSRMNISQYRITKPESFKRAIANIKEEFSDKTVMKIIESSDEAIEATLGLLKNELGLNSTTYIPSQVALLPLFDYMYERKSQPKKSEVNSMMLWFVLSSFNGLYSSSTNKKITDTLAVVRSSDDKFPIAELRRYMKDQIKIFGIEKVDIVENTYYDLLRGRIGVEYQMLLIVLLHRGDASNWGSEKLNSSNIAFHHIFPKKYLQDNKVDDRDLINSFGNLTPISPSVNSEIGETAPNEYLQNYKKEILESHFIPTEKKLWKLSSFEKFLDKRMKNIWSGVNRLIGDLEG